MTKSMLAAAVVVDELCALGVREAVLCPGSRSAPLAYALLAADADGRLRLHVRTDERTGAFLALGLAKASAAPVAVVTTSGTAAGNLLPALMEGHHSGVPVLAITADRPSTLVGTGANQTTDQVGLYGAVPRVAARIVAAEQSPDAWRTTLRRVITAAKGTLTGLPGPAHLNVELPDPLYGELPDVPPGTPFSVSEPPAARPVPLPAGPRTVVVAGDLPPLAGRSIASAAARASIPLLAEPSSNARSGATAVRHYRLLLASLADQVERVLVVGHPTLSRPISRLLASREAEIVAVASGATWVDPGWAVSRVIGAVELPVGDPGWLEAWHRRDRALNEARAEATSLTGPELAAAVVSSVATDDTLVLGSSNPIRDADLAPVGVPWPATYANRGLAGIDGTVSSATGIALATGRATTALVGDLTFLHDASGLALPPGEPRPTLRLVIADDAGGSIFAGLEHGAPERSGTFERLFATPPGVDVAAVARGYGAVVTEVSDLAALRAVLARPWSGAEVVAVRLDRTNRRAEAQRLVDLARQV